ncbi:MAG: hypothetical protein U5K30_06295 [Acidimicrobiales bacterium]|nr:hypothetical protein [Acidimicrobiales bacterium]
MSDDETEDDAAQARPAAPALTWADHTATVQQAMEWGIELCGQLAHVHDEDEVVGNIAPATITRTRFGQPRLPEPDPRADHAAWADVAALAGALEALVPDPSPEFLNALLPPYASALALGEELQDAQRAMGLPVAPIPFDGAPVTQLGGLPLEVPPDPPTTAEAPADRRPPEAAPDLHRRPNPWVLLVFAVVVLGVAVAVGLGWR